MGNILIVIADLADLPKIVTIVSMRILAAGWYCIVVDFDCGTGSYTKSIYKLLMLKKNMFK